MDRRGMVLTYDEKTHEIRTQSGEVVAEVGPALGRRFAASLDMERALLALHARAQETGDSIGTGRTAEQVALADMSITVPTSILREAFAALRKAGALWPRPPSP